MAGHYRVLSQLGRGGMAQVQRAVDTRDGREVALKQLTLNGDKDERRTLLFEREYVTLAGLQHPRIIRVFDYGVAEAGPYYTMELLDGVDLREQSPLSWLDTCRCLRDIASSLALMHAQRIVHRDVTPRNIRMTHSDGAKLLDFGGITPFGTADDLIGTPPFVPPEAVHGLALDQRADVFGLGATAYWVLTKQHAFSAMRMSDLAERWTHPVTPVSELNTTVPRALSELIASMLSLDPADRPASMAVVIDQLTAIGNLPAEAEQRVATSYLHSAPLVGREADLKRIQHRLDRARVGRGGVVRIEGAAGMGKTRLLANALLAAKLSGFQVARAQALPHQDPYALVRSLVDALLGHLPPASLVLGLPYVAVLHHLARRLPEELSHVQATPLPADPREQRGVIQDALYCFITDVATHTPLVLAIDDVPVADEPSLSWLTSVARHASNLPLLVLCTARDNATPNPWLNALTAAAISIPLGPLAAADTERLVEALFGDVPDMRPLANAIHNRSGGNPQHTIAWVEQLVHSGDARYVDGAWQLPRRLNDSAGPSGADSMLLSRLPQVSADARALLRSLSVCRGPIGLPLCTTLATSSTKEPALAARHRVLAVIGELVAQGLVVAVSDTYAVAQESLRDALYAGLEPAARAQCHARLADALLAETPDPAQQLEAGWHLLHTPRKVEGAELLEHAGVHFAHGSGAVAMAVPALEAALAVYRAQGRKPEECLRLLVPLSTAAIYVDHRNALKHVPETFALLQTLTGFTAAQGASSLSTKLALGIAVSVGGARHLLADARTRLPGYRDVLTSFGAVAATRAALAVAMFDLAEVDRTLTGLAPLTWLGAGAGQVVYEFASIMRDVVIGDEPQALKKCRALWITLGSSSVRSLPETLQEQWRAGVLNTLGLITSLAPDDACLEYARDLEAMGATRYQMYAAQIRMIHHAVRGEGEPAELLRRKVEAHAIQESSTWRMELIVSARLLTAYAVSGDVSGLKRITRVFERYAVDIPTIVPWAERARQSWQAARSERADAPKPPTNAQDAWLCVPPTLMRVTALNRSGQHAAAHAQAQAVLSWLGDDVMTSCAAIALLQEQAVSNAHTGQVAEAVAVADNLIARCSQWNNPLLSGLVLDARARIAFAMGDVAACDSFGEQAELAFDATDNPLLLARARALRQYVSPSANAATKKRSTTVKQRRVSLHVEEAFAHALNMEERAHVALKLVATYADVLAISLFLVRDADLERFDHGDIQQLPADAEVRARAYVDAFAEDEEATAQLPAPNALITQSISLSIVPSTATAALRPTSSPSCTVVPLVTPGTEAPVPVGALVIAHAANAPPSLGQTLLHALAAGLHTDATSAV